MRTALTVGWAKAAGAAIKKQRKLKKIRVIDRIKVGGSNQPRIRKLSMGIEPLGTSGVAISIRHHIYLNRTGTTKENLGGPADESHLVHVPPSC
jgi:hypothetical protein